MGFLEERVLTDVPLIPEFFKGKTIFITGGSGFIGKVLIEKLLYSCTDLDRVYLLLRSKKGVNPEARLSEVYETHCFDRLRKEKPGVFQSKVFAVNGDVSEFGLGLSEEDRALLVNRVHIIFHVAASVRFDDPLPYSAKLNLRGTKEMVELAKDVRDLLVFVHVSTSYSNTNRETIEEVMYPPLADWRETLEICDAIDLHTLRVLTPMYVGEMPNTYTFTKQLAEHVIYENRGKLPLVIVRPSIVISSYIEPFPGWIENFNGPVGICVACGKGILRSIYTKPDLICDFMPVDICVKHIIATAWIRGTKQLDPTDDVEIYNCCAGKLNHVSMKDIIDKAHEISKEVPLDNMLWSVGGRVTTSSISHYIRVLVQHALPAVFIDTILWAFGKKPMLLKIQRRIYIANLALQYFLLQQWTFENKNFIAVRTAIKEKDKKDFYYEVENVDPDEYFLNSCKGGKKYLLKEADESLKSAKAHYLRMFILDKTLQVIFYTYVLYWLWKIVECYLGQYIF
ncbi:hypothetical protein K1T71_000940 [Dendrolimus kikuchii]|uniref:Uncharacterized protein n=1 Tax=Dendrolimus kikuchii TaxID=765133 RepID=A0ACC1DGS4_9NEOP|nr:hypothetical protein K1T71_000940 [Dendrolimus kikuchii]